LENEILPLENYKKRALNAPKAVHTISEMTENLSSVMM